MDSGRVKSYLVEASLSNDLEGSSGIRRFIARKVLLIGLRNRSLFKTTESFDVPSSPAESRALMERVLTKWGRERLDPIGLDETPTSCCVLTGKRILNRWTEPGLVVGAVVTDSAGGSRVEMRAYSIVSDTAATALLWQAMFAMRPE